MLSFSGLTKVSPQYSKGGQNVQVTTFWETQKVLSQAQLPPGGTGRFINSGMRIKLNSPTGSPEPTPLTPKYSTQDGTRSQAGISPSAQQVSGELKT